MGAVRIPAPDAAERTKLLEDLHDRHFFALQVLSGGVPLHQVAEVLLAEGAALGRLEVVHQREDALALRGVSRDNRHQHDRDEAQHERVLAPELHEHAAVEQRRIQEGKAVFYPVEQLNSV